MMFCDDRILVFLFLLFVKSSSSCENITWSNRKFGHIENAKFFLGQSQPKNLSCTWKIEGDKQSDILVSLRIIEVENDRQLWSNELVFKTDAGEIRVNDINQRIFYFPSISTMQIDFPIKSPASSSSSSSSLNIHRFFLEFIQINDDHSTNFHCTKSGFSIPQQWKCNCLYECGSFDTSDEDDCPLCTMIQSSSNSLLCHSNESWCLPSNTNQVDSKGICLSSDQTTQCSYFIQCETIVIYSQDHGEILLHNFLLANRTSLCFVIMTKENHQIRLTINQYDFIYQRPDWEYAIYDGDQTRDYLLVSSDNLSTKQMVQTYRNHIATMVIRKRSIRNENFFSDRLLLNITWITSICSADEFLCGGHYERKCYTKQQRCDGIWDCISGDDELGCLPSSCPTTFACHNQLRFPSDQPRCYTWFERCDGNAFCPNRTDEQNCNNWWCNSNNGTFLCQNGYCIYETWRCDGSDDCGDKSDEIHCPSHVPRRIITAAILGATICCTLFLLALGCTCKLFHLRSVEQRASIRLANPEQYLEQRHSDDSQRVAPPSYSQTMGFSNDSDDRHAILVEQLRLAGLMNFIPSRARRHRHRRDHPEDSQSHRLDRFRSLFNQNLSINNNRMPTTEFDTSERHTTVESRELPPPYLEGRLLSPPLATVENSEQANSDIDDDDDDKMLVP